MGALILSSNILFCYLLTLVSSQETQLMVILHLIYLTNTSFLIPFFLPAKANQHQKTALDAVIQCTGIFIFRITVVLSHMFTYLSFLLLYFVILFYPLLSRIQKTKPTNSLTTHDRCVSSRRPLSRPWAISRSATFYHT